MVTAKPPAERTSPIRYIGPYRLHEKVSESNMAQVFRAVHGQTGEIVAIKLVRIQSNPAAEEARLRFHSETEALRCLSPNPNIPRLLSCGEDGLDQYFAMEWVRGAPLEARIARGTLSDPNETAQIIRQVASALDYAHRKGVIHQDLKPSNVMVEPDGTVKLIDFGIARLGNQNLTNRFGAWATFAYVAPERIAGNEVSGYADQFSLAVVAFRMLTGRMPFGSSDETVMHRILHAEPLVPSKANPTLPRGVDAALLRALAKSPIKRFDTCSEFAGALEWALRLGDAGADLDQLTRRTTHGLGRLGAAETGIAAQNDSHFRPRDGNLERTRGSSRRPTLGLVGLALAVVVTISTGLWFAEHRPLTEVPHQSDPVPQRETSGVAPAPPLARGSSASKRLPKAKQRSSQKSASMSAGNQDSNGPVTTDRIQKSREAVARAKISSTWAGALRELNLALRLDPNNSAAGDLKKSVVAECRAFEANGTNGERHCESK